MCYGNPFFFFFHESGSDKSHQIFSQFLSKMTTLPDVSGFGFIVWAIVILLLLILVTVIFLVVYSGVLEHIKVGAGKSKFGQLTFVYKYMQGPYSEAGEAFTEVLEKAPAGCRSIGIYYDDPRKTPDKETRYIAGAVLAEGEETVSDDLKTDMETKGYKLFTVPAAEHCVFAAFRYTTQLSIYLAVKRVYPALNNYIVENRLCAHPFVEIYTADKIHFFAPLSRQDDYYVPEVAPLEPDSGVRDDSFDSGSVSESSNASASERDDSRDLLEEEPIAPSESAPVQSTPVVETITSTEPAEPAPEPVPETTEPAPETAEPVPEISESSETVVVETQEESATEQIEIVDAPTEETKEEGNVTPDPVLTPSDAGSEQSGSSSSFEDLAAEARQIGKIEPTESDIQEIEERVTE